MSRRLPKPPILQFRFLVRRGDAWFFKRCRYQFTMGNIVTSFGAVGEFLMIGMGARAPWHVGFSVLLCFGLGLLFTGKRTVVETRVGQILTHDGRTLECSDIEELRLTEELEYNTTNFDRWGSLYAHSAVWRSPELLAQSITPDRLIAVGGELSSIWGVPWHPDERKRLRDRLKRRA